jgi:hypothetical protein
VELPANNASCFGCRSKVPHQGRQSAVHHLLHLDLLQDLKLARLPLTESAYRAICNTFTTLTSLDLSDHMFDFEGRTWNEENEHLAEYVDISDIAHDGLAAFGSTAPGLAVLCLGGNTLSSAARDLAKSALQAARAVPAHMLFARLIHQPSTLCIACSCVLAAADHCALHHASHVLCMRAVQRLEPCATLTSRAA